MITDEKELEKRVLELSQRSQTRGIYTETQFLTEGQQSLIQKFSLPLAPSFEGGHPEAERRIALFGKEEELGYPWDSSIRLLRIGPKDARYSAELTHRDFLGAILNLGVKRESIGDILIREKVGYVFVLSAMEEYLIQNLDRVHHTSVTVTPCEALPEGVGVEWEEKIVIAPSPRLDAVISAVWNLSRAEGRELVEKERVSVFGVTVTSPSKELNPGDRVSVRGKGRFYYDGTVGETRKGRDRIRVRVFI